MTEQEYNDWIDIVEGSEDKQVGFITANDGSRILEVFYSDGNSMWYGAFTHYGFIGGDELSEVGLFGEGPFSEKALIAMLERERPDHDR